MTGRDEFIYSFKSEWNDAEEILFKNIFGHGLYIDLV